jgi:hypothetical protein
MEVVTAAGAGFLLAVLWFDLMFDVQVRRDPVDPAAIRSIATYYRRVTTDARPMNRLVALAMLATLVSIGFQVAAVASGDAPVWSLLAVPLALGPILLAGARTVPSAVRLGQTTANGTAELALARRILADHLLCFAGIAGVLVVQFILAATT